MPHARPLRLSLSRLNRFPCARPLYLTRTIASLVLWRLGLAASEFVRRLQFLPLRRSLFLQIVVYLVRVLRRTWFRKSCVRWVRPLHLLHLVLTCLAGFFRRRLLQPLRLWWLLKIYLVLVKVRVFRRRVRCRRPGQFLVRTMIAVCRR